MRALKIIFYGILALIAIAFFFAKPFSKDKDKVKLSGVEVSDERSVEAFRVLEIQGGYRVYLQQGDAPMVRIEADENLVGKIITETSGDRLKIYSDKKVAWGDDITLYITIGEIEEIRTSGAIDLRTEAPVEVNTLDIQISGAGKANLDIAAREITSSLSGAGAMQLAGKAEKADLSISGAGQIDAFDMEVGELKINISGAGEAKVYATEQLEVEVSGAASVRYKGDPMLSKRVSGAGSVKQVD